MSSLETLADRLEKALERQGLSARQAAGRLGVSQAAVSRWLAGERQPDAAGLGLLMAKLGISADWLLTGEGSPEADRSQDAQYRSGQRDGLALAREAVLEVERAQAGAQPATQAGVASTFQRAAKDLAEAKMTAPPAGRAARRKDG